MRLLCPTDPLTCIPIRIGPRGGDRGARLGGRPPSGVSVPRDCTYFATVPLYVDPVREASIFMCFDFPTMLKLSDRVGSGSPLAVVVHGESTRSQGGAGTSSLSEHPLLLGAPREDLFIDEGGRRQVESSHKIGGRPYLVRETPELRAQLAELAALGYLQLVQLDFPGNEGDELVSGDWPFADGMFHLFGRPPFDSAEWRWLWQH